MIKVSSHKIEPDITTKVDAWVVQVFEGEDPLTELSGLITVPTHIVEWLKNKLNSKDFKGERGEFNAIPLIMPDFGPQWLIWLGMGKRNPHSDAKSFPKYRNEALEAGGKLGNGLMQLDVKTAGILYNNQLTKPKHADFVLGVLLGTYSFENYKQPKKDGEATKFEELWLCSTAGKHDGLEAVQGRAEAINLARDLGNHPANKMTPTILAERAASIAKQSSQTTIECQVMNPEQIKAQNMNLFLAVGQGSQEPARLITLKYKHDSASSKDKFRLLVVGKGITFDTGGISLKPPANMDEMKFDMCGAAAVLGLFKGLSTLEMPNSKRSIEVIGLVPTCENMPGGKAVKPGDIVKTHNGKTVEILNTDAEGRLILADALSYGIEQHKPDQVIDLATLTGACVVALGHHACGAISNDYAMQQAICASGQETGDIVWPLPNFDYFEEQLKGVYADLKNIGDRYGGTITGGLFLKNFVGDTSWTHLDIAGTAWAVDGKAQFSHKGATGFGVNLLLHYIQSLANGSSA